MPTFSRHHHHHHSCSLTTFIRAFALLLTLTSLILFSIALSLFQAYPGPSYHTDLHRDSAKRFDVIAIITLINASIWLLYALCRPLFTSGSRLHPGRCIIPDLVFFLIFLGNWLFGTLSNAFDILGFGWDDIEQLEQSTLCVHGPEAKISKGCAWARRMPEIHEAAYWVGWAVW